MTYSRHFVKLDYPYKKYLKSFDYSNVPGELQLHTTTPKKKSDNSQINFKNITTSDPTGPPNRDQIRDFNNNVCQQVAMHEYSLNKSPNRDYNEHSYNGLKMLTRERPKSVSNTGNIFSKEVAGAEGRGGPAGGKGSLARGEASSFRAR